MPQNTATEKDMFLQSFQRECQTTLKLLKAFPASQPDYTPHERSRTAKELGWVFVKEQGMVDMALKGKIDFTQPMPSTPATYDAVIAAFEKAYPETLSKVSQFSEEDLNRTIQFPAGPGKMADVRRLDVPWMALMDQVHHRGQLSVYIRMAGGKVPSIYGPTADEPWV